MKDKHVVLLILAGLITILIVYIGLYTANNIAIEKNKTAIDEETPYSKLISINTYDRLVNEIENEEIAIIVLGKSSCKLCKKYIPTLKELSSNYNYKIFYVSIDELSSEENEKIRSINYQIPAKCNDLNRDFNLNDSLLTPLTLFIYSGEVKNCMSGDQDKLTFIKEYNHVIEQKNQNT